MPDKDKIVEIGEYKGGRGQRRRTRKVDHRKRWMKRIYILIACFVVLLVGFVITNSKCDYYKYLVTNENEDNSGVSYVQFGKGFLKYSQSGVEYQKRLGRSIWNASVSFTHPQVVTSDNYALMMDRGSNKALLFDENGRVNDFTMKFPIVQGSVSDQGNIEVIMEGENTNYIFVCTKDGQKISEIKSSLSATGYPMTAELSPDGTMMVASYYSMTATETKTTLICYDFSNQVQNNNLSISGVFDFADCIIPRLIFTKNDMVLAIANDKLHYIDLARKPSLGKEVDFDEEIMSVFYNDKYTGILYDHSTVSEGDEGDYRFCLYNEKGGEKVDTILDLNYDEIEVWKNQIIAYRGNECTIMNLNGKVLFQGELDGDVIETVIPTAGWRKYIVVFSDKTVEMRLMFWE